MSELNNKIDFALVFSAKNANPNGDPLNGNRPRQTSSWLGEVSDVCLKRKIRNRLQDNGNAIFVQMDERKVDEYKSLSDRFNNEITSEVDRDKGSCERWIDVRAFGQVFAFKKSDKYEAVSIGVRGPVSIQSAFSVDEIVVDTIQITKSVNSDPPAKDKSPDAKSSDTMGQKHRVNFGLYVTYGSINCEIAKKTGFSEDDAKEIKNALLTIFDNDESSARPSGSMEVVKLVWWQHNCKNGQYNSAKVHKCLKIALKDDVVEARKVEDYNIIIEKLEGLAVEEVVAVE